MAQLNDLIVTGISRFLNKIFASSVDTEKLEVPTTSGGTTHGVGTSGQVLKSNGTSVYWGNDENTTYTLTNSTTAMNNLVFTGTGSGGGSSAHILEVPTIVRGTMNNDSSTATAFVVSATATITALYDGLTLIIKNTKVASAANCTLNINGLGAKRIWLSQSNSYCTTHWALNQTYLFVYDSTNDRFELQQGRDTNDTDVVRLCGGATHLLAGGSGIYKHSLYARLQGTASLTDTNPNINVHTYSSFTTSSGTGTSKAYRNEYFDITKIYYHYSDSDVASGSTTGNATVNYNFKLVNLQYTLNCGSTLTANKPVYLVFVAPSDYVTDYGKPAPVVNSSFPFYTQQIGDVLGLAHSTTALNEYIPRLRFVMVGVAYSGYQVDITIDKPIFMPDLTQTTANQWKMVPVETKGACSTISGIAIKDGNGDVITDTYVKTDHMLTVTQSSSDGHILTLTAVTATATSSASSVSTITIPDNNTTYSMSRDGSSVKLTPSSGSAQSVSLSDLITGLSVGTTTSTMDDYLIAQYSGGGSSNNTYYRRKLSVIMGDFIYTKGSTGTIPAGTICNGFVTGGSGNIEITVPIPKMIDPAVTTITVNKFPINSRYSGGYYFPSSYQSNGYDVVANDPGSGFEIARSRCVGTNLDIKIHGNLYPGVPCASGNNIPVVVRLEADVTVTFS